MRLHGYNVRAYFEETDMRTIDFDKFMRLLSENSNEMNIWPAKDSIRDLGSFVLIKEGISLLDKNQSKD